MNLKILIATFLVCLLATVATAAELFHMPALYKVTGVASDDTLNVRAGPFSGADKLDELAHDATGIEVIALNEEATWGQIGSPETNGWVSMAYLTAMPDTAPGIPPGMSCGGTEPFWGITFHGATADYSDPVESFPSLSVTTARSAIRSDPAQFGFEAATPTGRISGSIDATRCSDGMSDREFGWRVILLRRDADGASLERGCCTLDQR
ncbi:hypothetical protein CLV78_105106 [Aliiruegeria haliotis]|uniref:SH3 domain-containing protein n=1 Tax=Aliiruegeria haliotis TaxID=1280846 RepID=A0A2T0RPD8_9RHOB|nr:hypothetical protein [Aliiruegeria haliotis]PRY23054.1 hypothetical protein CLV78_105106 [Aliiruegeria haliotis]